MSESNEYGKLDEEKIKQFTGGEEISARALYQSAITFKPQFTLWLSCNDLPMVTDKSLFASERIKVIEFNRHFSPAEQDTHLKDELTSQEAMSGIFMWLVRGYIKYKEYGLTMSEPLRSVVAGNTSGIMTWCFNSSKTAVYEFQRKNTTRLVRRISGQLSEPKTSIKRSKYGRNLRVLMCSLRENSTQRWSVTPNGLTANQLPAVS